MTTSIGYTEKPSFILATLSRSNIVETLLAGNISINSVSIIVIANCILREDSGYILRENGGRFLREDA